MNIVNTVDQDLKTIILKMNVNQLQIKIEDYF